MYKNSLVLLTTLQMLFSIIGSESTTDAKKVVCYYGGLEAKNEKTLRPEDIDASVCTHIVFMRGSINIESEEINFTTVFDMHIREGESYPERLVRLKEANPNLKLLLFVTPANLPWAIETAERRTKIINSAVALLNATRFDGLEFPTNKYAGEPEALSSFFCEMHDEFKKYGYTVSSFTSENLESQSLEPVVERISRCSSHITLLTVVNFPSGFNSTELIAPINLTRSTVNRYVEKGYPANKLLVTVPTIGIILTLADPKETGLGAGVSGPGTNRTELTDGYVTFYNQIRSRLNDTNEGWTVVRGEEYDSPYAYSKTGIWTSFEDPISAAAKARFIPENNLGGALFFTLDMSDSEGMPGKTFPIIRAVSDTFKQATLSGNTES